MFGRVRYDFKWHQKKRYDDCLGEIQNHLIHPFDRAILNGTSMENSKLFAYINCDDTIFPVSYCNLYLKHKNVENLVMQGMGKFVNSMISNLSINFYTSRLYSVMNIKGIDWKECKPHRMLGLTKEEFIAAKKFNWIQNDIDFFKALKSRGVRPENLVDCRRYNYYNILRFSAQYPEENIMKVIRYLDRQTKHGRVSHISDISDYWNMLSELGEDIADPEIKYPKCLIRAHDRAAERIAYKESEELKAAFVKRFHDLARFDYVYNGLFIRPAASEAELIAEGKKLHHCVGGYAKSHASGDTAIFFIRHVSDPEISYFTLELDEEKLSVRQNRGSRNCARTDEVEVFEEKWLEHIRNLKETKKNDKRNSKSRNNKAA